MTRRLVPALLLLAALRASTCSRPRNCRRRRAAVASPRVSSRRSSACPSSSAGSAALPADHVEISAKRTEDDYVDNFYLDMNGIIHTCTHGDGVTPNQTTEQMVQKIFEYTERLIKIANPRRWCTSRSTARAAGEDEPAALAATASPRRCCSRRGAPRATRARPSPSRRRRRAGKPEEGEPFNSNCITPGTEFLQMLGERFVVWLDQKTSGEWAAAHRHLLGRQRRRGRTQDHGLHPRRAARRPAHRRGAPLHVRPRRRPHLPRDAHAREDFTLLRERQRFQRGKFKRRPRPRPPRRRPAARPRHHVARRPRGRHDAGGRRRAVAISRRVRRRRRARAAAPAMQIEGSNDDFFFSSLAAPRAARRVDAAADGRFAFGFGWDTRALMTRVHVHAGGESPAGDAHLSVEDGALNLMLRTYTDLLPTLGGFLTDKATSTWGASSASSASSRGTSAPSCAARREPRGEGVEAGAGQPARVPAAHLQKLGLHPNDTDGKRGLVKAYRASAGASPTTTRRKSWDWYYPDFYAPLARPRRAPGVRDLTRARKPFQPLSQLLSVLPPQSASLLPAPYAELMLSTDSPIFDAFPPTSRSTPTARSRTGRRSPSSPSSTSSACSTPSRDRRRRRPHARRARGNVLGEDIVFTSAGAAPAPPPAAAAAVPVDLEALKVSELKDELAGAGRADDGAQGRARRAARAACARE